VSGNVFDIRRQNFAFHRKREIFEKANKLCCMHGLNIHSQLHHALYVVIKCLFAIHFDIASEAKDWYGWQQLQ
jgi:hypothetical protein